MKWVLAIGAMLSSTIGLYYSICQSIDQGIAQAADGLGRVISLITLSPRSSNTIVSATNWDKWSVVAFISLIASAWWLWRLVAARFLGDVPDEQPERVSQLDWIWN